MVLDMRDPKQQRRGLEILKRVPEYMYMVDERMGDWQLALQGNLVLMGRKAYANLRLYQLDVVDHFQYN